MALYDRCCLHFSDERSQARSPIREGSGYEIRDKREETREARGVAKAGKRDIILFTRDCGLPEK